MNTGQVRYKSDLRLSGFGKLRQSGVQSLPICLQTKIPVSDFLRVLLIEPGCFGDELSTCDLAERSCGYCILRSRSSR